MELTEAKKIISDAGRELIARGLAARTWGNISCRADGGIIAVTPSGMAYDLITQDDIVTVDINTGALSGRHRPTSELMIHTELYKFDPDVNFIIHTHQKYATALGLAGSEKLPPDIGLSSYALPGTRELADSVNGAFRRGFRTVLMPHHGAVVAGRDAETTFDMAERLEKICADALFCNVNETKPDIELLSRALQLVRTEFGSCTANTSKYALAAAALGSSIPAQLDDAAMIFGDRIPFATLGDLLPALLKYGAALVNGVGIICASEDYSNTEAISALAEKVCLCYLHTVSAREAADLDPKDVKCLRGSYLNSYSKRLRGES